MLFYISLFIILFVISIVAAVSQKIKYKTPFYKNIATGFAILTFSLVAEGLRNPYTTFGWVDYRIDNMKEFSITSRTATGVEVYFLYQIQSETIFGTKIIYLTSEQFNKVQVGDFVDDRGNKISQVKDYKDEPDFKASVNVPEDIKNIKN